MTQTDDFYTREFFSGKLSISRGELESLPCPFCTDKVTDEEMQAIIDLTCHQTKMRLGLNEEDEIDLSDDTSWIWWEELEETVVAFDIPYYEDIDE